MTDRSVELANFAPDILRYVSTVDDDSTSTSDEEHVQVAPEQYQHGEVGVRGVADIADLTISEMMAEANERGVIQNCDEADLEFDV